jgi:hypothetical protein
MIFRRRRTRIEIEQTTVTVTTGEPNSVGRPVAVPSAESVPARVLTFKAPETTEPSTQPSVPTFNPQPAKETRS